ncbi:hypothetical protein EDB84DRAFT_1264903 [Lactarius hengduanensis]|nr:hypothetical protein EDB84DRAFT_1264903 [Lactarius hengduanensis]
MLNCLVLGEDPKRIFSVKIPVTKYVGLLKDAIKDKMRPTFDHIDASTLDLWKVSIPVDEHLEANISGMGLERTEPLLPVKKLSGVFSDKFEDEHLHIVIQPPASVIQANEPPRLELNCLVLGEDRNNIFTVKIPSTKSVSILKDAIKDKMRPTFDHIAAKTLTLWQVSIPDDSNLKLKLSELDLADERSLSPTQVLLSVFLHPPLPRQVHIVVRCPPARESEWLALATCLTVIDLPPQPPRASKSDTIGLRTKGTAIDDMDAGTFSDKLNSQCR